MTDALIEMIKALQECGYRRHTDPARVTPDDLRFATGAMLSELTDCEDMSALFEFLTEPGGQESDIKLFRLIADQMLEPDSKRDAQIGALICERARWYGNEFLQRALDAILEDGERAFG